MKRDLGIALFGFVILDYGLEGVLEQVVGTDPGLVPLIALIGGAWLFLSAAQED